MPRDDSSNADISRPSWARGPGLAQIRAFLRQRGAELERAPVLLARVIPALSRARWLGRESLVHVVLEQALRRPESVALALDESEVTYAELAQRMESSAAWLEALGARPGDAVALVGKNSLGAVVLLLAAARLGVRVALPPPELDAAALADAVARVGCSRILAEPALVARLNARAGTPALAFDTRFGAPLPLASTEPLAPSAPLPRGGEDDFVYIYTSGTTGSVKACRVSHRRALFAATAFGRLVHRLKSDDVLYCPLPLHHASGLLLGLCACLVAGAKLVLREHFSASAFLSDVRRHDATVLLYVGELGRALLTQPPSADDRRHRLRLALGNGMSADVWVRFAERFGIGAIAEFYAATEFPGAIVNLTGQPGSVGHLPFGRARGYRLVRVERDTGEIARDARGRAVECGADEAGELVLRLSPKPGQENGAYLGYLGVEAGSERVALSLFEPGDRFCRSGDLFRRDVMGHYYFVDRLGDTYRYKSENVSTRDVEAALGSVDGVEAIGVVGLPLPGIDGKLGLALIQAGERFSVAALAERARLLPDTNRPRFVRICASLPHTASLKLKKRVAAASGVDPEVTADLLYYLQDGRYLPLDREAYRAVLAGRIRL